MEDYAHQTFGREGDLYYFTYPYTDGKVSLNDTKELTLGPSGNKVTKDVSKWTAKQKAEYIVAFIIDRYDGDFEFKI